MPVTLASCLGLTSDALGACPHDYTFYSFFVCKYTEFFGKFQEKCEKYVYAVLRSLGDRYLGVTAS